MNHGNALRWALVLFVASRAAIVSAQSGSARPDEATEFDRGVAAMRAGDYERAMQLFEASNAELPSLAAVCNLARAADRAQRVERAIEAYERCAAEDTSGRFREFASQRARELRAASLPPPSPSETQAADEPDVSSPGPAATTPSSQPEPGLAPRPFSPPQRSDTWTWVGIGVASVGAMALVAGGVLELEIGNDVDYLQGRYPEGRVPAEIDGEENPDVALLRDLGSRGDARDVLYAIGIGAVALGGTLVVMDQLSADPERPVTVSLGPARATLDLRF